MTDAGGPRPERIPRIDGIYERIRSLDQVFVDVADAFGFGVARESGAFISYQGDGLIRIAPYAELDPDDTLAQMIVHELCHYFVEGDASRTQWDWGLVNDRPDDEPSELAAICAQAGLLDRFRLRQTLAPTTDYRFEYDRLPADLIGDGTREASRALTGLQRLAEHPSYRILASALGRVQELSRS